MKISEIISDSTMINKQIEKAFIETISQFSDKLECTFKKDSNWTIVQFYNTEEKYIEQTISFRLEKVSTGFDLYLADVYVPVALRNSGFLTSTLTAIRKIEGLSGGLRVEVGMDQAKWKKITQKTGFEWL